MNSKVISVIAMKTALDCCIRAPLLLVLVLALLQPAEGYTSPSECGAVNIMCRNGSECIHRSAICDETQDCTDGSDEDPRLCHLWPEKSEECSGMRYGYYYYFDDACRKAYYVCNLPNRPIRFTEVCKIILEWPILKYAGERTNKSCVATQVVETTKNQTDCPDLYARVGGECLSFFSPSKVTWDEANEFCLSIRGELWQSNDVATYAALLEYMRKQNITADYWIGGLFENVCNTWAWSDDTPMPLGAPFWVVKYNDTNITSVPWGPQTSPLGTQCHRGVLSPTHKSLGWCAAMTYQYFHYWSDEQCNEGFSPLCIYTGFPPPPTTTTTTTTSPNTTTTSPNTTTASSTTTNTTSTSNTTSTTIPSSPIPISTTYGN